MKQVLLVVFALTMSACATGSESSTTLVSDSTTTPVEETTTSLENIATTSTALQATTTTRPAPTTTRRTPAADPVIAEQGFWTAGNLDDGGWAAFVENPNSDWLLTNVIFDINIVDANNRVIDTDFASASFILPGQMVVISGRVFDPPAEIASLEFEAGWDTQDVSSQVLGDFTVGEVSLSTERSRTIWSGDISSTFEADQESVDVYVVLRDASGSIIGVDSDFVDVLAGRATFFEITMFDAPAFETWDIHVTP